MISSRRWACFWGGNKESIPGLPLLQRRSLHSARVRTFPSEVCMSDKAQRWRPCAWHPAVSPTDTGHGYADRRGPIAWVLDRTFEGMRQGAPYYGIRCLGTIRTNDGPMVVSNLEGKIQSLGLGQHLLPRSYVTRPVPHVFVVVGTTGTLSVRCVCFDRCRRKSSLLTRRHVRRPVDLANEILAAPARFQAGRALSSGAVASTPRSWRLLCREAGPST